MFYHNIQNYLDLGFVQIKYYGIIYALGFVLAYFLIKHLHSYFRLKLEESELIDLMLYLILGIVVGSRLFYCFVYAPQYFIQNPIKILYFWNGGLSFHGGFIGAIIATYMYSKNYKKNFLALTDAATLPAALALCLGRIGNLINGELIGRVTNLPFCINYKGFDGCRHPSQVYASIKNLIIFITLFSLRKKKLKTGSYSAIFIAMYSTMRFIIGYFREPDPQVGYLLLNLTMGQWLNIIMFTFGVGFLIFINRNNLIKKYKKFINNK